MYHSVGSVRVELSGSVVHGDIDVVKVGSGGIRLWKWIMIIRFVVSSQ